MTLIRCRYRRTVTKLPIVCYEFLHNPTWHADYQSETAIVLDLVAQDDSVRHLVATYPTGVFSDNRTGRESEMSIVSKHLSTAADFVSSPANDSFWFVQLLYGDFNADRVLSVRNKFTPRRWVQSILHPCIYA